MSKNVLYKMVSETQSSYLAMVDLSTLILLDGKVTGSTMIVDMIGSKKLSGASESNNSSSLLC